MNGVAQQPIDGLSLIPTFDDAKVPAPRRTQYFNVYGNRSIYHDGWMELIRTLEWLMDHWDKPDEGIWETRGGRHDYTYSRLMSWVAVDAPRLAATNVPRTVVAVTGPIARRYLAIAAGLAPLNTSSPIGSHASGDTGRSRLISGLNMRLRKVKRPIMKPSGMPTSAARPKPMATRLSELSTFQPTP